MIRIESTDTTHPKALGNRQLARIDDIPPVTQSIVKKLEIKRSIGGHPEGHNDGSLQFIRQQRLKAQFAHTRHQQITIGAVTATPP